MGLGGMYLKQLSADQRAERKLPLAGMAFKVEHVGQFAPHDGAKKAGILAGDVLISVGGQADLSRETDLLAYSLNQVSAGADLAIVVLRNGDRLTMTLKTSR